MSTSVKGLPDTSYAAEAVMLEIYRRMPTARKVELVDDANRAARQLAMAGRRRRHPNESTTRLRRRLLGLTLGEQTVCRVYGALEPRE